MAAPKSFRSQGIVLESKPLSEADLMVTLLTSDEGKLRAVARGARKTTSKLVGHLEPLNRVDISVARGKEFQYVSQAQVLDNFLPLKNRGWAALPVGSTWPSLPLGTPWKKPLAPASTTCCWTGCAFCRSARAPTSCYGVFEMQLLKVSGLHAGALLLRGLW